MQIIIHNPNNLPLINYHNVKPLQGKLKTLKPENYKKLKKVLEKRGFSVPLFIWKHRPDPSMLDRDSKPLYINEMPPFDYFLMDGHARQEVMIKEDMQPYEVPYILIEADNLNIAKAQLLEITSQYNTITKEGFSEFTGELDAAEFEDTVFDAFSFGSNGPDVKQDTTPSVSSTPPVSKLGEIYQLGRHRLMCGDSTDFGTISDLMDGHLADMVFTDPPYNVNWQYRGNDDNHEEQIFSDNLKPEQWNEFVKGFTTNMLEFIKDGAVYYECTGYHSLAIFEYWLTELLAPPRQMIVWAKNQFVLGRFATDYHRQHEQIWYGWKAKNHAWYGGHKQSDLWEIDKVFNLNMIHSTEKPVALPAKAIANSSKEGDIILDLFTGSGSTLIACEQLNRTFYGMELDPKYCDVIRKRYWQYINNSAEGWEANTPSTNAQDNEGSDNDEQDHNPTVTNDTLE